MLLKMVALENLVNETHLSLPCVLRLRLRQRNRIVEIRKLVLQTLEHGC